MTKDFGTAREQIDAADLTMVVWVPRANGTVERGTWACPFYN